MRQAAQCVYSPSRALYRVFIGPAAAIPRPWLPSAAGHVAQLRQYAAKSSKPAPLTAKERADREDRGFDRRFTTQKDIDRSGRDRPPQDHEITDPQVMVIDNGTTEGPLATSFVLTKLETDESLRMIQPYVPADTKNGRKAQFAVCKIVNKRDEYTRQRQLKEKKKTAAAAKPKTKELELTWAIGEHDLATKMRQMGGFLSRGMKVEVLLAKKKGGKQVDSKEAQSVVQRIREEVSSQGARESKPATGAAGGTMRLYLEGKKA